MIKLTRNGLIVPLNNFKKEELEKIKKELTVTPKDSGYSDISEHKIYKTNNDYICLPRFYGIKKFKNYKNKLNGKTKKIKFKGELRDYQQNIVKKAYEHLLNYNGGIISVPCGRGKTIMAIKLICMLKCKTLVVVHKSFLIEQWIERIKQFTDAKIGIIQQDKIDIEGKDIVLGMIQSISMKKYNKSIFKKFKFVIYDECHRTPAKIFSKALFKTGSPYVLGLSATPTRKDGLTKIMKWYMGDIIYQEKALNNTNVIAKIFHYETTHKYFIEKKIFRNQKPNIQGMVNNLCKIPSRLNNIIEILKTIIKINPDRKILILSDRLQYLETLKIEIDKIKGDKINTYMYTGKTKKKDRIEAEQNGDILFSTFGLAQEGLDIERLNTIFLITPKNDIKQAIGRIMRKILSQYVIPPLIIDFCDELSIFKQFCLNHKKLYHSTKYKIQEYYIYNGKLISKKEYYKKKEINDKLTMDYTPNYNIIFDDNSKDNKIYFNKYEEPKKENFCISKYLLTCDRE